MKKRFHGGIKRRMNTQSPVVFISQSSAFCEIPDDLIIPLVLDLTKSIAFRLGNTGLGGRCRKG